MEASEGFHDQPPAFAVPSRPTNGESPPMSRGPFQPGDSCNQYKIVRSLGQGGFGHVYEAVREFKVLSAGMLQPFGQNVALTCLVVDQANDPERLQRLNLEA